MDRGCWDAVPLDQSAFRYHLIQVSMKEFEVLLFCKDAVFKASPSTSACTMAPHVLYPEQDSLSRQSLGKSLWPHLKLG